MSKKLAESLDALVLDVKFGSGAFMKSQEQATLLAQSLVKTGQRMGVKTTALLTNMNQPLGRMCGNAVEIQESLDTLRGEGPEDVRQLTVELAADLLLSTGIANDRPTAIAAAADKLDNGSAYEKFKEMIAVQGGDPDANLVIAPATDVASESTGVVTSVDTNAVGLAIIAMGGGRQQMTDRIDHSVGVEMLVRVGDTVDKGQPLARVFSNRPEAAAKAIPKAISVSKSVEPLPLIVDRI